MTDVGRSPLRGSGLRPTGGAVPSPAEPLVPNACRVPPEGWHCTRKPGHDGPCAAIPDPIVGSGCLTGGGRIPIRKAFADDLWAQAEAADKRRREDMPDERSAINQLFDAQLRLKELGWKDPVYAPKDGSPLDIIELGSTGIHRGHYEGEWPTGSWWIVDGDVWPCRPALARPASGMEAPSGGETACGLDPKDDSPTGEAGDARGPSA